jgi:hypothetical protein
MLAAIRDLVTLIAGACGLRRHCERSEAIQWPPPLPCDLWIPSFPLAALRVLAMTGRLIDDRERGRWRLSTAHAALRRLFPERSRRASRDRNRRQAAAPEIHDRARASDADANRTMDPLIRRGLSPSKRLEIRLDYFCLARFQSLMPRRSPKNRSLMMISRREITSLC